MPAHQVVVIAAGVVGSRHQGLAHRASTPCRSGWWRRWPGPVVPLRMVHVHQVAFAHPGSISLMPVICFIGVADDACPGDGPPAGGQGCCRSTGRELRPKVCVQEKPRSAGEAWNGGLKRCGRGTTSSPGPYRRRTPYPPDDPCLGACTSAPVSRVAGFSTLLAVPLLHGGSGESPSSTGLGGPRRWPPASKPTCTVRRSPFMNHGVAEQGGLHEHLRTFPGASAPGCPVPVEALQVAYSTQHLDGLSAAGSMVLGDLPLRRLRILPGRRPAGCWVRCRHSTSGRCRR